MNLPPGLQGIYVHKLLVNAVAMWASPKYAIKIFMLLDNIAKEERDKLEAKNTKQEQQLNEQEQVIEEQRPRMVPKHKETNYKYMIWKEEFDNKTFLHLVRRNNHTFRDVNKIRKDAKKCWFFKDNLPIAMTPNDDVKDIVRANFKGDDYEITGCNILILTEHLPTLYQLIEDYFNSYQE